MSKECVVVPEVYLDSDTAHAVAAGDVVYTSAIGPVDARGRVVGYADLGVQSAQVYQNLEVVLRAAGASWNDVATVRTYVAPHGLTLAGRRSLRAVEERYLPPGARAGLAVSLPPAHPDWLIAVEVIAHPGAAKECITDIRGITVPPGWAQAVRVGNLVYLGSQMALGGEALQVIDDDTVRPIEVKGDIAAQTERVYEGIGAVLRAAGAAWEDVVKVYQYATRNDVPFDRIRRARERYLTAGRFISTSVVCQPEHPRWSLRDWLIEVELDAYVGPKHFIHAPGVWANPGGLHAMRIGGFVIMQAQMSRDGEGRTLHPDDIVAHTEVVFRNLDGTLDAAGIAWRDIVHARTFCRDRRDITEIRRVRDRWLTPGEYVGADVIAGFFDPNALVEVLAAVPTP